MSASPASAAGNCGSYGNQSVLAGSGNYYSIFCVPVDTSIACPANHAPTWSAAVTTTGFINVYGAPKFVTYTINTPTGRCAYSNNLFDQLKAEWGPVIGAACEDRGVQAVALRIGKSGPYGRVAAYVYYGTCFVRTIS
ncbi:MAG: hypothetical protein AAFP84_09520 [Actinomycetota bacterium]